MNEGTALRTMVGTPQVSSRRNGILLKGHTIANAIESQQYLAPEIVMQTTAQPGYENVVDSWSLGVIVYSMMSNVSPAFVIALPGACIVLT